ncbi:MAG: hypothetical protein CMJ48_03520 [Planctomycetaceae bacterium]|nr:hypothetical protein [Planctomycetaceae bacterium]
MRTLVLAQNGIHLVNEHLEPRGTVVLTTTIAGDQTLALTQIVIDEIMLVGSRCGPFDKALAALERRDVDVASLISRRFSLQGGLRALEAAKHPGVLKVLIDVADE